MNNIPKKSFVLNIANKSNALDTLMERICMRANTETVKITKYSRVKKFRVNDIIRNQKVIPADTANALNLGDESSILDRINECD